MNSEQLAGLLGFAFVSSITPGPNNMMLMASGVNYGIRRTIPHMLGVAIGFTAMIALVGIALARLFEAWPPLLIVLKVASTLYLLWLAWKLATTESRLEPGSAKAGTPMTFLQAAAFQWVNPKAWTMALTAISVYGAHRGPAAMIGIALVFGAVNLPAVGTWALLGQYMRRWLGNPVTRRYFNWTMAVLLLGSVAVAL